MNKDEARAVFHTRAHNLAQVERWGICLHCGGTCFWMPPQYNQKSCTPLRPAAYVCNRCGREHIVEQVCENARKVGP